MWLLLACDGAPDGKPAPEIDDTAPPEVADADGDGFADDDCDDDDATVFPGAVETLGDTADGDCDGGVDTTAPTALGTLDGTLHGIAVAANSSDVYLHVQLDTWTDDGVDRVAVNWTGTWKARTGTFEMEWWTGWTDDGSEDLPYLCAPPDLEADEDYVVWASAYRDGDERNVMGTFLPTTSFGSAEGTRIVSYTDTPFGDADLLRQEDGTWTVAGCDPEAGELVMMHGTAQQYIDVEVPYDYEYAFSAYSCSVAALTGALIVADPTFGIFDIYSYSDDGGLEYQLGLPGYHGYDLDTRIVDGAQWTADAEAELGLRLVAPTEAWWTGADVRELDLAATASAEPVVAVLDADGAPWVVWGEPLRGASLAGTFPHADDIGITATPEGDLLVAVAEADEVYWARWRVAPAEE